MTCTLFFEGPRGPDEAVGEAEHVVVEIRPDHGEVVVRETFGTSCDELAERLGIPLAPPPGVDPATIR